MGSRPIFHPKVEYVSAGPTGKVPPTALKVLYPSGLRGWIANPLFVSSNLTGTSIIVPSSSGRTLPFEGSNGGSNPSGTTFFHIN